MNPSDINFYKKSISYILDVQRQDGSIPWEINKKLDPWDHVEAAMGLSIGGKRGEAERCFAGGNVACALSWLVQPFDPTNTKRYIPDVLE